MADTDSDPHDVKGEEAETEEEAENNVEVGGGDGKAADDEEDADDATAEPGDEPDADEDAEKQDGNLQDDDADGKVDDQEQPPEDGTPAGDDDQAGNAENEADGPPDENAGVSPTADEGRDQEGKTSPTQDGGPPEEEAGEEDIDNQGAADDAGVGDEVAADDGGVGDEGAGDDGGEEDEGVGDEGAAVDDDAGEKEEDKVNGAPTLTDEQRARCRQLFDRQAVNGRLDIKGFKTLFRLMGEVLSSSDAEQMFEEGDKDDNGTIEFDEFSRLYALYSQEEDTRKRAMMESIEKLFPSNGDQQLELKKVEQVLLKLQHPGLDLRLSKEKSDLCPEDIKSLVRAMDADGSGKISKQEFVDTLCQHIEG
ncbi:unnamed protein product [Lymnaea stagnalis]|uniref:EF-hand domain-containing protein n=1 Tax=Lymnaea stagnalis TaxID=6523 RepID=A0AAV2HPV1_LYMST